MLWTSSEMPIAQRAQESEHMHPNDFIFNFFIKTPWRQKVQFVVERALCYKSEDLFHLYGYSFFNSFEISDGFPYGIFVCLFLPAHFLLLTFIPRPQSLSTPTSPPSPSTSHVFYHHFLTSFPWRCLFFHSLLSSFMTHTPSIHLHTLNLGSAYEKKNMSYLPLWVWIISRNIIISSSGHFLQMSWFQFSLWPNRIPLHLGSTLSLCIHLLMDI